MLLIFRGFFIVYCEHVPSLSPIPPRLPSTLPTHSKWISMFSLFPHSASISLSFLSLAHCRQCHFWAGGHGLHKRKLADQAKEASQRASFIYGLSFQCLPWISALTTLQDRVSYKLNKHFLYPLKIKQNMQQSECCTVLKFLHQTDYPIPSYAVFCLRS